VTLSDATSPPTSYRAAKQQLVEDGSRHGLALGEALADLTERWLRDLFDAVVADPSGVSLMGVGGVGRRLLGPASDVDVVLVHSGRPDASRLAELLWYPIWDEGVQLGYATYTVDEALSFAGSDLHVATSLLDVRHLVGDEAVCVELAERALANWRRRSRRWLAELADDVDLRGRQAGEVAFLLEPDLKDGRGGIRDVHAMSWADRADVDIRDEDRAVFTAAYGVLAATRIELQRRTGQRHSVLHLQEQDAIGEALGYGDGDGLMAAVAHAARQVTVLSDDLWPRFRRRPRRWWLRAPAPALLSSGVVLDEHEVQIHIGADPASAPLLVLHAANAAAEQRVRIDRVGLRLLQERQPVFGDPWPEGGRKLLVDLLGRGRDAIGVIESLDVYGVWSRVIPEWEPTRSKPQRNAYHTFTVDRHLLEAAAEAARLTHRVKRPDLLLVGALLHDIGKGYPGDHTVAGMELVPVIARRMGFDAGDVDTLVGLVQHHLLLPDIATRRDLDDEATVRAVANRLPSAEFVELLWALTEADSLATGPAAWGNWKADLVATLAERVIHLLQGGEFSEFRRRSFPTPEQFDLMATGRQHILAEGDHLTVVAKDIPRQFSQVAGVLALSGLSVLQADAYSSAAGQALSVFRVERSDGDAPDWTRCVRLLERALAGRLAIDARVDQRTHVYRPVRPRAAMPVVTKVSFDTETSDEVTIVEIRTAEGPGVLYRITKVLADLTCDLRFVKAQTLNHEVVDTFYVTSREGMPLDSDHRAEVALAVRHALDGTLPG
jgi:[protein-PII] uridylyltransferase